MPMTNRYSAIIKTTSDLKPPKSPSKASIEIIRQFARTCVSINDVRLNVMIAN